MPFWSKVKPSPATQPRAPSAKMAGATGQAIWHSDGASQWGRWSYSAAARTALANNPVVQRCLRLVAESTSCVRWSLHDRAAVVTDDPLLALLRRPNPLLSRTALIETIAGHLLLHGNAFVEKVMADDGQRVLELHVLRPDCVSVEADSAGWPTAYRHSVGVKTRRFPVDPVAGASHILHIKALNPLSDHQGQSSLQAALTALDLHKAADGWSQALLENAARPSGALVVKTENGWPGLSEEQYDRLKDQIQDNYQGAVNAGRPMVLEGGLTWQPMGFSPADMDFQATKQAAARDIALAFGVPPMLLGIPGDNTYANYQEANRALWRLTVLPLTTKLIDAFNAWLPLQPGQAFQLDEQSVPALATDRDAHWTRVANADFLSAEEKRSLLNLPPAQPDVSNPISGDEDHDNRLTSDLTSF